MAISISPKNDYSKKYQRIQVLQQYTKVFLVFPIPSLNGIPCRRIWFWRQRMAGALQAQCQVLFVMRMFACTATFCLWVGVMFM